MSANPLAPGRAFAPPPLIKPSLAICVVHDDDFARDRAEQVGRHLLGELGDAAELSFSWWRSQFLWHPQALQMAGDAVAHAHVILFSWRSGHNLPLVITNWLDEALARRAEDKSVSVALLESVSAGSSQPSLAAARLRRSAQQAGVNFLFHAEPARRNWSAPIAVSTSRPGVPGRAFGCCSHN